jgi:transcription elongation factor Elf1
MKKSFGNMMLHCDNCHKQFKIRKLKTKWIDDNVQRTYFICPYCKQEYTSFYTDKRVRKNIKKIEKLQSEMESITEQNKEIMQELRQKYEGE